MADFIPPDPDHVHPFIDRIAVIATVTNQAEAADIHSNIWTAFKDESFSYAKPMGRYREGKRIELTNIKHEKKRPFLHYAYSKTPNGPGLATRFRIEFSPVDLNTSAMIELNSVLTLCMDGGWEYFVKHGTISKIEVSVDLPGVRMGNFHLMTKSALSMRAWSNKGQLGTVLLGKKRGNQYRVYDRGNKRIANGQPWPHPKTTRVERILRGTKRPLIRLPTLENPFKALSLVTLPPELPLGEVNEKNWQLFCDSIAVRGVHGALQLLSAKKRPRYRKWLEKHGEGWWQPELFWSKWPAVLADSKIADPKAWH